jgi:NAD(P)-dependent dehydrogenase (short-subunit alcohol dehydrogenase family)
MDELRDRVAVVTGAASGIGFAACERFASQGMRVVMADVDPPRLQQAANRLVAEAGADVIAVPTDVSRWESVESLATRAVDRFGAVHVLCNNAGVQRPARAWECTVEAWNWLVGVNLNGVFHGIKAFVPAMIERGEPGHVVNTASIAGLLAHPGLAPYSATKFGVVGLSESLWHDLRAQAAPIGVSVLCPGAVATQLHPHSRELHPGGPVADILNFPPDLVPLPPAVVAAQIVDAIRADRFWILTHPGYNEVLAGKLRGIVETDEVVLPGLF